jgi:hypothetical protein
VRATERPVPPHASLEDIASEISHEFEDVSHRLISMVVMDDDDEDDEVLRSTREKVEEAETQKEENLAVR